MKKFIFMVIAFMMVFVMPALAETVAEVEKESFFMEFLTANIEAISIVVTWLVVRLVPTKWKDPILMVINWLISLIPDKKSGGGKHE